MARFALLLPREEMVEPAGRIARELEMDVYGGYILAFNGGLIQDCRTGGLSARRRRHPGGPRPPGVHSQGAH